MKRRCCSICHLPGHDRRTHAVVNPDFINVGGQTVPMRKDKHPGKKRRSWAEQQPYSPILAGESKGARKGRKAGNRAKVVARIDKLRDERSRVDREQREFWHDAHYALNLNRSQRNGLKRRADNRSKRVGMLDESIRRLEKYEKRLARHD